MPELTKVSHCISEGDAPWGPQGTWTMIDNQGKITMRTSITLDSTNHSLIMKAKGGGNSINIMGETGDIELFDVKLPVLFLQPDCIVGLLGIGGHGKDGTINIVNKSSNTSIFLDGGKGVIILRDQNGKRII